MERDQLYEVQFRSNAVQQQHSHHNHYYFLAYKKECHHLLLVSKYPCKHDDHDYKGCVLKQKILNLEEKF